MNIAHEIRQSLTKALESVGVSDAKVTLEFPAELSHGDYATSVALAYAKQLQTNPHVLAEKIVAALGTIDGVSNIQIAGPGFINFTLANSSVYAALRTDDSWGKNASLAEKKIMVEYTDPNPFKEFHIGHLMSNAIGESITRLIEFSEAKVLRANWQGDVGPHVAKAIWGYIFLQKNTEVLTREANQWEAPDKVQANNWGIAYQVGNAEYEKPDGIAKSEIEEINKKVYDKSDPKINELYDLGRKTSLERFEEIYKILGTKFNYYFFEGTEGIEGVEIVRDALARGVFEESEGAVVFKGEIYGLHTRVFLTSKGLPTYEAKELGLNRAKFLKEPALDKSIIITANEQSDYFKVVLRAMEMVLPDVAKKTQHISHGMMRFAEGKMSSRTGNVITGESLLQDLRAVALERSKDSRAEDVEALATQLAVAAVKFQILRGGTSKDIIFDRERALSVEGDSGPYLQYAYARTCAILEKARTANVTPEFDASQTNSLARLLIRFPDIVARAQEELQPHHVANYLISIAAAFNSWYAQEQILDGTPAQAHKVALTDAVRVTLKNGLWLLGISAPEKM